MRKRAEQQFISCLMKSIVRVVADANAGGKPRYKLFRKERREYVQKSEKAKSQPGQRWC